MLNNLNKSQIRLMTNKTRSDFGLKPLNKINYSIHGRPVYERTKDD